MPTAIKANFCHEGQLLAVMAISKRKMHRRWPALAASIFIIAIGRRRDIEIGRDMMIYEVSIGKERNGSIIPARGNRLPFRHDVRLSGNINHELAKK